MSIKISVTGKIVVLHKALTMSTLDYVKLDLCLIGTNWIGSFDQC